MDDALDECRGTGGVWEDGVPVLEGEVGGHDEALLFVASADELEEQVGVSVVEGEVADLVEDEQSDVGVVAQASLECARGLLCAEVEQSLCGGDEEDGAPGEDGVVGEILGNGGLAEAAGSDEDDVSGGGEEVQGEQGFDQGSVDGVGPVPVEVGDGLELLEATAGEAPLEASPGAIFVLESGNVLEQLGRSPALLGGEGDDVIEGGGGDGQAERSEQRGEITHDGGPCGRPRRHRSRGRAG